MIKISVPFLFSSDFESVFAYQLTGKILSFEFYPKAVYFECKFWILQSAITHVQNWKWRHLLTSLRFQRANAIYYVWKTRV